MVPASILEHHFADCHSFDLSVHSKDLRRVDVNSNWSVNVMFHHQKQKKIHMQISALIQLEGLVLVLHKGESIPLTLVVSRF